MIYPIVIYGSDVLRKPCERITPDYPEVKKLVEDMFLTLGEAEGVGLAAPQILSTSALSRRAILPIPLSSIVRCAITEVKRSSWKTTSLSGHDYFTELYGV